MACEEQLTAVGPSYSQYLTPGKRNTSLDAYELIYCSLKHTHPKTDMHHMISADAIILN